MRVLRPCALEVLSTGYCFGCDMLLRIASRAPEGIRSDPACRGQPWNPGYGVATPRRDTAATRRLPLVPKALRFGLHRASRAVFAPAFLATLPASCTVRQITCRAGASSHRRRPNFQKPNCGLASWTELMHCNRVRDHSRPTFMRE